MVARHRETILNHSRKQKPIRLLTAHPFINLIAFAIGFGLKVPVSLVGTLRATEFLCIAAGLVYVLPKIMKPEYRTVLKIALWGLAWIGFHCVSDFVNTPPRTDVMKGLANIGLIVTNIVFFAVYFRQYPTSIFPFLCGLIVGGLVMTQRTLDETAVEFWDLYISYWLNPLMILVALCWVRRSSFVIVVAYAAIACLAVVFNGRSEGLIAMLIAFLCFNFIYLSNEKRSMAKRAKFRLVSLFLVGLTLAFIAYSGLGQDGTLGSKIRRDLATCDNPWNPIEVAMSARGGVDMALRAIEEAPLLGHGSKAKLWHLVPRGLEEYALRAGELPVHSVFFQAWVFSGIVGALFWIFFANLILKQFTLSLQLKSPPAIYAAVALLGFSAWHIAFSPFGFARYMLPYLFGICYALNKPKPASFSSTSLPVR